MSYVYLAVFRASLAPVVVTEKASGDSPAEKPKRKRCSGKKPELAANAA